jgi:hypothetical protein
MLYIQFNSVVHKSPVGEKAMRIYDQYVEALRTNNPTPSPAMAAYINGLETIKAAVHADDLDTELAERQARWEALTEEEQIACQVLAATL